MTGLIVYLVSINHCFRSDTEQKFLDDYMENPYFKQVVTFIDKSVCPLVKKYRSPLVDDFLYQLENLIVAN